MSIKKYWRSTKKGRSILGLEPLIIFAAAVILFIISSRNDFLEVIYKFSRQYEAYEIDEILTISLFLTIALTFHLIRKWRHLLSLNKKLENKNEELQNAFSEIRQLKGIISICTSCKKIRDDKGFWQQVEVYISKYTKAEFSHGLCPDCFEELYPGLSEKMADSSKKDSPEK